MKSLGIKKHSIVVAGHKTSVSLEDEFWAGLREIAGRRGESLSQLIEQIDAERKFDNLSSALRLFVLRCYRDQPEHQRAMVVAPNLDPSNSIEDGQASKR